MKSIKAQLLKLHLTTIRKMLDEILCIDDDAITLMLCKMVVTKNSFSNCQWFRIPHSKQGWRSNQCRSLVVEAQ